MKKKCIRCDGSHSAFDRRCPVYAQQQNKNEKARLRVVEKCDTVECGLDTYAEKVAGLDRQKGKGVEKNDQALIAKIEKLIEIIEVRERREEVREKSRQAELEEKSREIGLDLRSAKKSTSLAPQQPIRIAVTKDISYYRLFD